MADKAQVQRELENRMKELQTQINHLNSKIEQSGEEARAELQRTVNDLQARNEKAEQQLKELREASDDVWKTMANDIETYWSAFTDAFNNVFVESDKKSSEGASPQEPFSDEKS